MGETAGRAWLWGMLSALVIVALLGFVLFATCAGSPAHAQEREDPVAEAMRFDLPAPSLKGLRKLSLWATYYYVPQVDHRDDGHPLHTMDDVLLARLGRIDWCEAAMQGTVLVALPGGDSVTYNYAGIRDDVQVDCTPVYPKHPAIGRTRFAAAVGPWGDGVNDMILLPYRSIAVDPKTVAFGTAIYVPAARGTAITLPDGTQTMHDGWFYAADRGGAIKGTHVDVFVGIGKHNPFSGWVTSRSRDTFAAYVVPDRGGHREAAHPGDREHGFDEDAAAEQADEILRDRQAKSEPAVQPGQRGVDRGLALRSVADVARHGDGLSAERLQQRGVARRARGDAAERHDRRHRCHPGHRLGGGRYRAARGHHLARSDRG